MMTNLFKNAGSDSEMVIFPKSNHFFSHNGKFVKGKAVNGCADNPVVIKEGGGAVFLDGSEVTREIFAKNCRTQRTGSGKTREDLDKVVKLSVGFFIEHLNCKL